MISETIIPDATFKFCVEVDEKGHVQIPVPFKPKTHITVIIFQESDDLAMASQTSMGFWDNPADDEEWNDV